MDRIEAFSCNRLLSSATMEKVKELSVGAAVECDSHASA